MLFNSFNFLIFFPAVVLAYFLIPQKIRYLWLLAASYYFYMCWNPKYVLLLLFSTGVTFLGGLAIERFQNKKTFLTLTVIANLTVLFAYKYFDFAMDNLNWILNKFHIQAIDPGFDILLPVGISFYTFQALGYTIDVYRKEIYAEKNFLKYALFVSFFPQLVAGPIERSKNLLKQVSEKHTFDYDRMRKGLLIMLWGYFLKLVIADRAAIFVNVVYGDYVSYGGIYIVIATLLFAVQIYCDFAGYSTIAKGAALIMGFRLMENFEAPYFAKSVAEFWRRWHISLSGWFRDYLYIPLGGNRKGKLRKQLNTMIVFLVSGLWHGASWNFVIWGGLNGFYQVVGMWWQDLRGKIVGKTAKNICINVCKTIVTFILVDFSWLFFRADSIRDAFAMLKSMLTVKNFSVLTDGSLFGLGLNQYHFWFLLLAIAILWITDYFKYKNVDLFEKIEKQNVAVRYFVYMCLFCAVVLFGIYGVDYEASQFIYFQF
ncbi:MAG: MBOAT family protein [Lachnospiraceae bacterium]|nr:MBOAT family protein [Lachnospiraceae bacterium]